VAAVDLALAQIQVQVVRVVVHHSLVGRLVLHLQQVKETMADSVQLTVAQQAVAAVHQQQERKQQSLHLVAAMAELAEQVLQIHIQVQQ
jgi:hypothetical protein